MSVRPAKTQISLGIRPVWSESSLCAQWVAKDPSFLHADSEDSDQTGRMPRLIWVFAGRTLILLVLSCRGSFIRDNKRETYQTSCLNWTQSSFLPREMLLAFLLRSVNIIVHDKTIVSTLQENIASRRDCTKMSHLKFHRLQSCLVPFIHIKKITIRKIRVKLRSQRILFCPGQHCLTSNCSGLLVTFFGRGWCKVVREIVIYFVTII